jgi:hypothetical protein
MAAAFVDVAMRVPPPGETPYIAKMKVGFLPMYLLKQGVIVRVQYDPRTQDRVEYDDDPSSILERNLQWKK